MTDRLEEVLASVGRHLVVDATADELGLPAPDAGDSWARVRRGLLAAAIIVALLAASIASIPPARRAVGGWLRAGRIEVSVDPHATIDPTLPSFLDAATPIEAADAPDVLGQVPPNVADRKSVV